MGGRRFAKVLATGMYLPEKVITNEELSKQMGFDVSQFLSGITLRHIASRSLAADEYAAKLLGIPIKSIYLFIWAISFGLAGLSGILVAPRLSLEPTFMIVIQLKAFIAAVLGGMNSVLGAVIGGLLLGVIENFVAFYIPQIKDSFSLILVVLVLLFLPQGLFGKKEIRRA